MKTENREALKIRQTARRHNNPVIWTIVFIAAAMAIPNAAFKHVWIDLRSVEVADTSGRAAPKMKVERVINRRYWGSYSTTVRTSDGRFVCQAAPPKPFFYNPQDGVELLTDLGKWLAGSRGKAAWAECYSVIPPGATEFRVETCHLAIGYFGVALGRRCVKSNVFRLVD